MAGNAIGDLGVTLRTEESLESAVGSAVHPGWQLEQDTTFLVGEASMNAAGELMCRFIIARLIRNPVHVDEGVEGGSAFVVETMDTDFLLHRFLGQVLMQLLF